MSNIFPEMAQTFSKEVEDRANTYFQQIYNQPPAPTMSIDEVLTMLKSFKDSHDKTNRVSHRDMVLVIVFTFDLLTH